MLKYFATFAVMDGELDCNIMWHNCLLLSVYDANTKTMQVLDVFGFNGLPPADDSSWVNWIAHKTTGLQIDVSGNHGLLYREEYRYLDRGKGLHGVTFELSHANFQSLQMKCVTMVADQNHAINEAVAENSLQEKSQPISVYPYEHHGKLIFEHEQDKSRHEKRSSRLKLFQMPVVGELVGMSVNNCKTQLVDLLQGILTPEQIARITVNGWFPNIPRMSGPMEKIFLHSTGPISILGHDEQAQRIRNSRTDSSVKLYWTLPPQEFESLGAPTDDLFYFDEEYEDDLKDVTRKLQGLEWFFRNTSLDERYRYSKNRLIKGIVATYQGLFALALADRNEPASSYLNNTLSFFGAIPQSSSKKVLLELVKKANCFFNSLYFAAVDNWHFEAQMPRQSKESSTQDEEDRSSSSEDDSDSDSESDRSVSHLSLDKIMELAGLAACLTSQDKSNLCSILGRTYSVVEETSSVGTI